MSIMFVEGRGLPKEFRQADLGDAGSDIANLVQKASPWDFLTGVFVTKPAQQAAEQAAVAQSQAQAAAQMQAQQQNTLRTAMLMGAGVLGLLAVVAVMRRPAARVAGYHRRSKRRSR